MMMIFMMKTMIILPEVIVPVMTMIMIYNDANDIDDDLFYIVTIIGIVPEPASVTGAHEPRLQGNIFIRVTLKNNNFFHIFTYQFRNKYINM